MRAIDIMVNEHENIKRMLKVVRKVCFNMFEGKKIDFEDFSKIIEFIIKYADNHHHRKEEIMLFNRMVEHMGAIGEKTVKYGMLVEHDMGRMYIKDLEAALYAVENGDEEAKLDVIANAISYTHLLERHIEKENNVIYKFAERELSEEIFEIINLECNDYEKDNELVKEQYLKLIEELEVKYIK